MAAPASTPACENAVNELKKACDEAYSRYPNSCSHAVWFILTNLLDPKFGWLDANHLIDFLIASSDWKEVAVDEGWRLAKQGVVVIGGLKKPGGHGHVIVIYPGDKKASGGYAYTYKDKKTGQGKTDILRSQGTYPRALSTSIGSWPGAKSKGDKTVWDPWASDDFFSEVKFWTKK